VNLDPAGGSQPFVERQARRHFAAWPWRGHQLRADLEADRRNSNPSDNTGIPWAIVPTSGHIATGPARCSWRDLL